jgi:hypothetical protein
MMYDVGQIRWLTGQGVNNVVTQSLVTFPGQFVLTPGPQVKNRVCAADFSDDLECKMPINHLTHVVQYIRVSTRLAGP